MKKGILIIGNKESIIKITVMHFAKEYDLIYFENPLHGIAWLEEGNMPDLILSDIRMPIMRGDEFLHFIKNNDPFKSIPFVILSSEDNHTQRIRLLESGADDYIAKPLNSLDLKVRLKKILE